MRAYAIGDIHGQSDFLRQALDWLQQDMARHGPAPCVFIGDLIDRGPDSRGTITQLIEGIEAGKDWHVLKGNHDRMMVEFLRDPAWIDPSLKYPLHWLHPKLGGAATLRSYGIDHAQDRPFGPLHAEALVKIPQEHRDFLARLPSSLRLGRYFFAHAGIRPQVPLVQQREEDLLWIREPFLSDQSDHGALVVHGHTPLDHPALYPNRVNLDGGAAFGRPILPLVLEEEGVFVLGPKGRQPLPLSPFPPPPKPRVA